MLYYHGTDLSEISDVAKINKRKECIICYFWFFNHGFKFQNSVCNDCHDFLMLVLNISDIAITIVKGVDYRCIIHKISKSDAIHLFKNSVLDNCRYVKNEFQRNQYQKRFTSIILTT